ncbi:MAG: terminase large subunit domain-containing protein [Candidatus Onthomonas sp.]
MPLTDKQREYLQGCSHRWNVKTGATGSGKSFVDYAVVIPKRILAARGEGLLVLMGNTRGTLERNILSPMRELWGADLVGQIRSDNTVQLFGRKCYALGADNKKHVARIQGATFEYVYGDEVPTWSEDVFAMLKSRLRCEHSHFDGTGNPDNPQHWFKKFLDSSADIYQQSYTIDDGCLPPAVVEQLKREYAGTVYYSRFILGQWAAANGVIYRAFADSIASNDGRFLWPAGKELRPWRVQLGVDFGGSGSKHALVATGILPGYRGCVALASARIEPGDVEQLSHAFLDFVETVFSRWGEIHAVCCDSAEQTIIRQLRAELSRTRFAWLAGRVYNAKKRPILDRIRLTSILMGGGRFWYLPQAATLRDALSTALWSGKHPGVDERLDDGTTDVDSLDAFEYSIERDVDAWLRR